MEIFAKKNIWKKIVIIFILLFSFSVFEPKPVEAGIGGTLMKPVSQLVVGFGDGVMKIIHHLLIGQDLTIIRIVERGWLQTAITIAIVIVIAIAATICIVSVVGAIAAPGAVAIGAAIAGTGTIVKVTVGAVLAGAIVAFAADAFAEEVDLPIFSITPETIISNRVPLFDANFIKPKDDIVAIIPAKTNYSLDGQQLIGQGTWGRIEKLIKEDAGITDDNWKLDNEKKVDTIYKTAEVNEIYTINGKTYNVQNINSANTANLYRIKNIQTSEEQQKHSLSYDLRNTVSKWYNILRVIAIVGMMSVLVYIGIRILLSSTSTQKAKYKELLQDWAVGMVLLFTMHYIMNFANIFTEQLTEFFTSINPTEQYVSLPVEAGKDGKIKIKETLEEKEVPAIDENSKKTIYEYYPNESNPTNIIWHTNLTGTIRIHTHAYAEDGADRADSSYIGYSIMYIITVFYTLWFGFIYIKRAIYLAFLTIIAPLVALTYPIDKANDGQAQGFNTWFREYMFNLLLQPMHLLLYTLLVSSAAELATTNWVYSLIAIGFIGTAEKILRTLFNFQKAKTPSALSGAAGAALAFSGIKWLGERGAKGSQQAKGGKDSINASSSAKGIKSAGGIKGADTLKNLLGDGEEDIPAKLGKTDKTELSPKARNLYENKILPAYEKRLKENPQNAFYREQVKKISEQLNKSNPNDLADKYSSASKNSSQNRSRIAALKSATNKMIDAKKERYKRSFENATPIRNLARVGAKVGAGAMLGTLGVAAGLASEDYSKVLQYGIGGALAGGKLGGNAYETFGNPVADDAIAFRETYRRELKGEQAYNEEIARKNQLELAHSEETIRAFQEKQKELSYEEIRDTVEKVVPQYMDAKEDDPKMMAKFEKFRKDENNKVRDAVNGERELSPAETVQLNNWIGKYQIDKMRGEEDREKAIQQFYMDYKDKGFNERTSAYMIDLTRKLYNELNS